MISKIETFNSGWSDICLAFGLDEIDRLIVSLQLLQKGKLDHFHIRNDNDCSGDPGIFDIEFSLKGKDEIDNMNIDTSLPHYPKGGNK